MRARVTEPTTGCKKEIRKVLPEANEAIAYQWLADERARVRAGALSTTLAKTRFQIGRPIDEDGQLRPSR